MLIVNFLCVLLLLLLEYMKVSESEFLSFRNGSSSVFFFASR